MGGGGGGTFCGVGASGPLEASSVSNGLMSDHPSL